MQSASRTSGAQHFSLRESDFSALYAGCRQSLVINDVDAPIAFHWRLPPGSVWADISDNCSSYSADFSDSIGPVKPEEINELTENAHLLEG